MARTLKLFKVTKIGTKDLNGVCHLILDGDDEDDDLMKKFAVMNYLCPDADDFTAASVWFKAAFSNLDENPMSPPSHTEVHAIWDTLLGIKPTDRTGKTDIATAWGTKHYHTVLNPKKGSLSRPAITIISQCLRRMNDKSDKTFVLVAPPYREYK